MTAPAARRFYADVSVAEADGGWAVLLDGRGLRTPAKARFLVPGRALADAIAAEWAAQGETMRPETMRLTRLANVAIDRAAHTRAALVEQVRAYAATDLLCYRAPQPRALCDRQSALWDPPLAWVEAALGARLATTTGALAVPQDEAALDAIARAAHRSDDFALTALAHGAGLMGSSVLSLALAMQAIEAEAAHACAFLEEAWQIEVWGADEEAVRRGQTLRAEIDALALWSRALTFR
jgi:chaperone required for assembly of F1-ATPase